MTDAHDSTTAVAPVDDAQPVPTHFELRAGECVADGLRRIVLEQVDLATWHTRRVGAADEHVHGVRQATKRVRAVLRLVRDGLGEESYRNANVVLRDVARDLSGVRSATVRVDTLGALVEWYAMPTESVAELHSELVADAARMRVGVLAEQLLINDLVGRLGRVRDSFDGWALPPALVPTTLGLGRTYRRGRRGMETAYGDRSTDRFHEWRKRVKYLRHQLEVLTAVDSEKMPTITASFAGLGDGLGLDHDLADLAGVPAVFASRAKHGDLLGAIAQRRTELQADLKPLAERLYARTPHDFVRDVTTFREEWGSETPPDAGLPTMPEAGLL
ncbi:MAG: CHAD domain-containing protein [Acidimicrobiia bacterium]|nr:MAG: CHAD domain-containing protein [Acidimicrobiia bacterium]